MTELPITTARSALLNDSDGVRAQVKPHFRFRTGGKNADKVYNVNHSKELMEKNTFAYKVTSPTLVSTAFGDILTPSAGYEDAC